MSTLIIAPNGALLARRTALTGPTPSWYTAAECPCQYHSHNGEKPTMKRLLPILGIVAALLLMAAPALAAEDHTCDHTGTTIESLHHCVMHAYDSDYISKAGAANSLLARARGGPSRL